MVGCHGYEDRIQPSGQPETIRHRLAPINKQFVILQYQHITLYQDLNFLKYPSHIKNTLKFTNMYHVVCNTTDGKV